MENADLVGARTDADVPLSLGRPFTVGWALMRAWPWTLLGPYPHFDLAVDVAEKVGSDFMMAYGERPPGTDDFPA